jgi:glycosyltransferase involved in cell wall biosynthesis
MSNKKTVLFVAPYFPPHSGGLERYVYEIAKHLSKEEWRVVVLTTSEKAGDVIEEVEGCSVYRLSYNFKISNSPFSFSWFSKVRKILREVNPSLVNVHTPVPGLGDVVTFFSPRHTPLVVTYHAESMRKGVFLLDVLAWLYEHGPLAYMLHKAKHIVCSSDVIRFGFLGKYVHKSVTINPGVDVDVFVPSERTWDAPTLLFVASLGAGEEYKGLEKLFGILKEVRKEIPNVTLRVVGDGVKRTYYKAYADRQGLVDAVTFMGRLEGERLVEEYQKAHVLVHPTSKESFGMVIAEAMACGLPVVSTTVGGIPELVESGVTGVLVSPNDMAQFTKEVIALLHNPERADMFGKAGRVKVLTGYSWEGREQAYQRLFLSVLHAKPTVAHIVGYFPPHIGGMEVVAQDVSVELAHRGYAVEVLTSDIGIQDAPPVLSESGFRLRRLVSFECAHTPLMWMLPLRLMMLPKNSVLHVHLAQVLLPEIALCVATLRRFPLVMHFHLDVEPSGKLGWLFLWYKKHILPFVLQKADRVIVFSKEQEMFIHERYGVKHSSVRIIPNGISAKSGIGLSGDALHTPMRILYVGRLTVQKCIERLIESVPLLPFPVAVTIVGDGEDREKLEELAREKCSGAVVFEGMKTLAEARTYFSKSDVFVIPSDKEGMPIAIIEAMTAGLPVVGSNVMGIRELLEGVGVLVENPSPESFAEALKRLHSNPVLVKKLKEQSKKSAERYTIESVGSMLENMYEEL